MSNLAETVQTLKNRIAQGAEPALKYLEELLAPASPHYNTMIQLKARYHTCQRALLLGTIEHEEFERTCSSISQALLVIADELLPEDLRAEAVPAAPAEGKRGEILYHIPDAMQLEQERKCLVRIAWNRATLQRDWKPSDQDVTRSIRISEIMAVQLLNADESGPFAIRTLSETVQFVEREDFTEWVFYVRPLRAGRFPLLLRVSVIEVIREKEYKKDIILEEEITVVAEAVPEPVATPFKAAGAGLLVGGEGSPAGGTGVEPPVFGPAEGAETSGEEGGRGLPPGSGSGWSGSLPEAAEPEAAWESPAPLPPPPPPSPAPSAPQAPGNTPSGPFRLPLPSHTQSHPAPSIPPAPARAKRPVSVWILLVIVVVIAVLLGVFVF
jgi:hypothetical protein